MEKLKKFEDVDVIASLEAIMKQNTAFYQSDFDIDKRILLEAAARPSPRINGSCGSPARPGLAASGNATFS